jgi:hypothetical protein
VNPTPRTEHLSTRPSWGCRTCERPWPCTAARKDMLDEFEHFPSVLIVYMQSQMTAALVDMTNSGQSSPPDHFERFISWTTPTTRN